MSAASTQTVRAFDGLAERYDTIFTNTPIGRAQRRAVWSVAQQVFKIGDRVLELNCGTGEDAIYLARLGVDVTACDASEQMVAAARRRHAAEDPQLPIAFETIPIEHLGELEVPEKFDGVFSNFSGLNCVDDLERVARDLTGLAKPGAQLLLCLSSRVCAWELLWFAARLQPRRAVRRLSGECVAHIEGHSVQVWYPTVSQVRRAFTPTFRLRSFSAVGLFVPPSYAVRSAERTAWVLRLAEMVDRALCHVPLLRAIGDHVLFHFERSAA